MAYKFLKGVFVDDNLLNQYESQGYHLVDIEEHMGMYDVLFSNTSSGGDSKIYDITYNPDTRILSITKSDGTVIAIDLSSGSQGAQGAQGETGAQGAQGAQGSSNLQNEYKEIRKITDYTYYMYCGSLDYDYAEDYYGGSGSSEIIEKPFHTNPSLCTSVRKGNFYGRNFDWLYDNSAEFVVKTPRRLNRYATIGVGGFTQQLTQEFVDSKQYSELYKMVPFKIVDGMNECGVVVNTNVVPWQKAEAPGQETYYYETTPTESDVRYKVCNMMLPRYILDHFDTAAGAVEYIKKYVSVYSYQSLGMNYHYDLHIMIGDKDNTYLMEFVYNENSGKTETVVTDISDKAYMTNFYLQDVTFNNDGSVCTPYDHSTDTGKDPGVVNNITSHGSGLERYNLVNTYYDELSTESDMRNLMNALFYTNSYKDSTMPRWYTEGVGNWGESIGDVTVSSDITTFDTVYGAMKDAYERRDRSDRKTWQTVHSSVYNLDSLVLKVRFQEGSEDFAFGFDQGTQGVISDVTYSGNILTITKTNGEVFTIDLNIIPDQTAQNGKVLSTDGSAVLWEDRHDNVRMATITTSVTDEIIANEPVVYDFSSMSTNCSLTITLGEPVSGKVSQYACTIATPASNTLTVSLPQNIKWASSAPTFASGTITEINIENNMAIFVVFK